MYDRSHLFHTFRCFFLTNIKIIKIIWYYGVYLYCDLFSFWFKCWKHWMRKLIHIIAASLSPLEMMTMSKQSDFMPVIKQITKYVNIYVIPHTQNIVYNMPIACVCPVYIWTYLLVISTDRALLLIL